VVEPWVAERVVDEELARALVELRFPDLAPAHVAAFGVGFDNTAYLVNDEWVFRFPRRAIAVPWIEREAKILPAIAPRLPLAIPVPEKASTGDERFPWPFAGYRRIAGTTACRAALDDDARARLAAPLGRFLAALHRIPEDEARSLGAGDDEMRRTDVAYRSGKVRRDIVDLVDRSILSADVVHGLLAVIEDASLAAPHPTALVHGDLYVRHLLVVDADALAGVIDWGDVHVGDPAVDLAIAYLFLPPSARETFFATYGVVDVVARRLARLRSVYHAVATLRFAVDVGDTDLRRESLLALTWI